MRRHLPNGIRRARNSIGENIMRNVLLICVILGLALSGCAQNARRGHSLFDKFHEDDLDQGAHKSHEMTVFGTAF